MTKTILALLAILSLNASAYAAEIDPKLSSFTWRGSKITGDYHAGQVSPESSSLTLVAGKIESGEVVFAMNSITVSDLDGEWKDKFLGHIKGPDFFDVSKFPTTTLKLSSIKNGTAAGELTVKGVTQPISFTVKHVDATYVGKATFDRTKFGITFGSGSFFENLGDKLINDAVDVEFTLALKVE